MSKERYFRHFKGGLYKFIGEAKHSETQRDMVVYQAMYGDKQIWVRPKDMFYGMAEIGGKQVKRFQEIVPYARSIVAINSDDFKLGDVLQIIAYGNAYLGRLTENNGVGYFCFNPCFHVVDADLLEKVASDESVDGCILYEKECTAITKVTKCEFELFRKYEDENNA